MSAFFGSIPAMILLTGVLVGASAALLGSFLVLRGTAMLTDAISHSIVLGIVLVWLVTRQTSGPVLVLGAAAMGVVTVVLTEALARSRLLRMDAAIGLVFPALFALGVLLIALNARNLHLDVDSVLLGEIGFVWLNTTPVAGVQVPVAVLTLALVLAVNLGVVLALWKELKLATFDPGLAAALGFRPGLMHYIILTLTSITAVAAFEAVGAILFVAFVVAPPAAASLLTRRLGPMVALAVALSVLATGTGFGLASRWDVSIGGMMALMTGVIFALVLTFAPGRGIVSQALNRRMRGLDRDCQVLLAHLQTHKGRPEMAGESRLSALIEHLHWPEERARGVVLRALDRGLIERRGELLVLSAKGEGAVQAQIGRARPSPGPERP